MLRDRGTKKWTSIMLPEHIAMLRLMRQEQDLTDKPEIDEYMEREFDSRICLAMEYNYTVRFAVWQAGLTYEKVGRVHYIDPLTKQMRIERADGDGFERLAFGDVVGVEVVDDEWAD